MEKKGNLMMTWAQKLADLPDTPGVYFFKDQQDKIIYVGKAASLSKRVKSYFQKTPASSKERILIAKAVDLGFVATTSEVEALILESNLIKTHRPRYNVQLKDDKAYPYIKLTLQEEFPRICTTRRLLRDGAKYFGPYPHANALRKTLKLIKEIFPLRTCEYKIKESKTIRPCLDFHIKRCVAPCGGNISKKAYQKIVEDVCLFLGGRMEELIKELRLKMKGEAQLLRFEEAAGIRDQISALERIMTKQQVVMSTPVEQDIIGMVALNGLSKVCVVVFQVRNGRLTGQEQYHLEVHLETSLARVMAAFVKQYYSKALSVPQELVLSCWLEDERVILKWLEDKRGRKVKITVPQRGKKKKLVELATKNAELFFVQKKGVEPSVLTELQKLLNLAVLPRHIEAFDISNLSGKEAVGSLVVFEDGIPEKSKYRRFKIKSLSSPNDPGMLAEVVNRRYSRLLKENKPLPDLVMVDGGRPQLSAAWGILQALGLEDLSLIGLAKPPSPKSPKENTDKIFTLQSPSPIQLSQNSAVLHLAQQIRDEAHRFALQYHRKLRLKAVGF